jgi:hypothetical protein
MTSTPRRRFDDFGTAAVLVTVAVLVQTLLMGRAVIALDAALLISLALWAVHPSRLPPARVLPVFAAAIVVQAAHLVEEYRAGFQRSFPSLFGYIWEDWRFLSFNVAWLVVLGACAAAMARRRRLGYLGAFFLAIGGGIGNGIGHLALAAREGGYFPGVFTAPLSIAAGSVLLVRLLKPAPNALPSA